MVKEKAGGVGGPGRKDGCFQSRISLSTILSSDIFRSLSLETGANFNFFSPLHPLSHSHHQIADGFNMALRFTTSFPFVFH